MSQDGKKQKMELTEMELKEISAGAIVDVTGGEVDPAIAGATTTVSGWTDEEGVFHAGDMPGSASSGAGPDGPAVNPEVGFTA